MAIVNPFKTRRCPYCGYDLYPGNCAIVSSLNKGKILQPARSGFLARLFVESVDGYYYTQEDARRECPNCKSLLPPNIEFADSYTIAIVGDVSSGKSHYIASCIYQLQQSQIWQVIGCITVAGQGNTDNEYFTKYFEPVFKKRQKIPRTQQAASTILEPLIYEVVFRRKSVFRRARTINLFFYDSSGEDIIQPDRLPVYSHYVLNASAIIFLADPLAMSGIVNQLPTNLRPNKNDERQLRPHQVLNRVIQTFARSQRIRQGNVVETPLAITLSKSDLLKFVVPNSNLFFLSDSAFGNNLDTHPYDMVSEEVQMLLKQLREDELINLSAFFDKKNFFAVSPTGWAADANGRFPTIEPKRCLDPLLWALWKLQIIDNV